MAESSYPTPSNGRLITEAQYERLMSTLQASGLVGNPAAAPLVFADGSGRQIKVRAGRAAYVRGRYWESGATETIIPVAANTTGSVRRDWVVLGLSRTSWNVTCYVKTGSTTPPTLTQDVGISGTYEIPLAQLNVPAAATSLAAGDVVPLAWYLGATPLVTTSATLPPVTVGALLVHVLSATRSTLYVGIPGTSTPVWMALVTSGVAPLGTYAQYIGTTVEALQAPATHSAMPATTINVLPNRYVRISARVLLWATIPASGQLDILVAGQLVATSGRKPVVFTSHKNGLDAEFFFRTAPGQATLTVASNVLVFDGAQADTRFIVEGVHVNVTDHGPYLGS